MRSYIAVSGAIERTGGWTRWDVVRFVAPWFVVGLAIGAAIHVGVILWA
jgi:uncharacterized membrane protein YraQ (UPF0718 family)